MPTPTAPRKIAAAKAPARKAAPKSAPVAKSSETVTLELTFAPDRETKGAWRFAEVGTEHIGTIYVRKSSLGNLVVGDDTQMVVRFTIANSA